MPFHGAADLGITCHLEDVMARLLWTQRQDIGPAPRAHHAMAYAVMRKRVVLFGGARRDTPNFEPNCFGDTWEWDGESWIQVGHLGPSPRYGHAMAYDSNRGCLVLFGGVARNPATGQNRYLDDTWEWDGTAWTQVADSGPGPRWGAAAAFDESRSRTVLFGGDPETGNAFRDTSTWVWDGADWTEAANSGPPSRAQHVMAYENARGRIIMLGGTQANIETTWGWDGRVWTILSETAPPTGTFALAHDSDRGRTILLSNVGSHRPCDTWELDGDRWRHRQDMGPQGRSGHALAYDQERQRVVLFGGASNPIVTTFALPASAEIPHADTWELTEHLP